MVVSLTAVKAQKAQVGIAMFASENILVICIFIAKQAVAVSRAYLALLKLPRVFLRALLFEAHIAKVEVARMAAMGHGVIKVLLASVAFILLSKECL